MPWVDLCSVAVTFPGHSCCLAVNVLCLFLTMPWVDLCSVAVTFPGHSCCLAVSVLCLFLTMPWLIYGL